MTTGRFANKIAESSTSTGTGNMVLSGAQSGYRAFGAAYADSVSFYYEITFNNLWEIGIGHKASGSLVRDTVLDSSSGGLVTFPSGTKAIFLTLPSQAIDDLVTADAALDARLTTIETEVGMPVSASRIDALEAGAATTAQTYGIITGDTKGVSTAAEVAFTNNATVPEDVFAVGDEVEWRFAAEVAGGGPFDLVTVRLRAGGASGRIMVQATDVAIDTDNTALIVFGMAARVSAIGAALELAGIRWFIETYDPNHTLISEDKYAMSSDSGFGGALPATTSAIDFVGTVQFAASSATNGLTLDALSVTRKPRAG